MKFVRELLDSDEQWGGAFNATLNAHGRYHTFEFVLRLSPKVHQTLAALPSGVTNAASIGFEGAQAFSTLLHETVHWWQHIGSTYGLMLSLAYPVQAHSNHAHLKNLIAQVGLQKSVRLLAARTGEPRGPGTLSGLANTIINNHFDIEAFRGLTVSPLAAEAIVRSPLFESLGHAFSIAYGNTLLILAATFDEDNVVVPHPKHWEPMFSELREKKQLGYYYGSPVELFPFGAREIFEGQARFAQLQYLHFGSGGSFDLDAANELRMLHGVYGKAFTEFLRLAELEMPPSIDHPTVGLFLVICDMAMNPGAGFPFQIWHPSTFIQDIDPGARFWMLCRMVVLKCPEVTRVITNYSREEYLEVSEKLADALLVDSPMRIAEEFERWIGASDGVAALMEEHRTFAFANRNLAVRLLFAQFLSFMQDKLVQPEFFCWPGAWMAGHRVSNDTAVLFDRHGALFLDKADQDGIFPRLLPDRDQEVVHAAFESFYAMNVTYDMTRQWIVEPGPFRYDYQWMAGTAAHEDIRNFANRHFEGVYGASPNAVEVLS